MMRGPGSNLRPLRTCLTACRRFASPKVWGDMTDTSDLMSALTGENKRPIWPFALPAILIASVWAGLISASSARDDPPPADLDGPSMVGEAFYTLGSAVVPAVVVWAVFQLLAFHRRAFSKSLWVLALMIAFSFILAIPARLASVGGMPIADLGGAVTWTSETRARFQAGFAEFAALVPAERFNAALSEPTPDMATVNARLDQVRPLAAAVREHLAQIDAEEAHARRTLADLELSEETRAQRTAWLDAQLRDTSQVRRMPALIRLLELREEMLVLLQSHPQGWTGRDGRTVVLDAVLLQQLRELDAEFTATHAQFRAAIGPDSTQQPVDQQ